MCPDEIDYEKMTAPCGLPCFDCVVHLSKENPELREKVAKQFNMPPEKVQCNGCREVDGNCPVISSKCRVFPCAKKRGVKFCYECPEFPCDLLHPCRDKADSLPHNTKVFQLCLIKKMGLKKWAETKAKKVKEDYFKKKFEM